MSYEFKTLGSVEALTEVPENANVLVEVDGAIKRAPGGALGGSSNSSGSSGDTWDFIIRETDEGEFTWEKGEPTDLIDALSAGNCPRACLFYTNGNTSIPNARFDIFVTLNVTCSSLPIVEMRTLNKNFIFDYASGTITRNDY